VDPEMRQEFEEAQKAGPLASLTGKSTSSVQNFDMAAWMAGSGTEKERESTSVEEKSGGRRRRG
jgi:hypothetical protein